MMKTAGSGRKLPKPRPHEKPTKKDKETEEPITEDKDDEKTKLVKAKVLKPMPEKSYRTVG